MKLKIVVLLFLLSFVGFYRHMGLTDTSFLTKEPLITTPSITIDIQKFLPGLGSRRLLDEKLSLIAGFIKNIRESDLSTVLKVQEILRSIPEQFRQHESYKEWKLISQNQGACGTDTTVALDILRSVNIPARIVCLGKFEEKPHDCNHVFLAVYDEQFQRWRAFDPQSGAYLHREKAIFIQDLMKKKMPKDFFDTNLGSHLEESKFLTYHVELAKLRNYSNRAFARLFGDNYYYLGKIYRLNSD